jgi:adenylosuccinate synthase
LPPLARKYVEWLEKLVGVPIVMLSVGPDRDQIIPRRGAPIAALV